MCSIWRASDISFGRWLDPAADSAPVDTKVCSGDGAMACFISGLTENVVMMEAGRGVVLGVYWWCKVAHGVGGERKLLGCGRSEDLERHPTSHMKAAEQLWEAATRPRQQTAHILIPCPRWLLSCQDSFELVEERSTPVSSSRSRHHARSNLHPHTTTSG